MDLQSVPTPSENGVSGGEHSGVSMKQRVVACASHALVFIAASLIAILYGKLMQAAIVPFFVTFMAPVCAFHPIIKVFPNLYLTLPISLVLSGFTCFTAMLALNKLHIQSSHETIDIVVSMFVFMAVSAIAKYAATKASGAELI